jgi:hypothetical protein
VRTYEPEINNINQRRKVVGHVKVLNEVRDDRTERHRRSIEGDTPPPQPRKIDFTRNKMVSTDSTRM